MRPKNRPMPTNIAPAPTSLLLKVIAPLRCKVPTRRAVASASLSKRQSVGVDAGGLDQRLPPRDFRFQLGLEGLGRGVFLGLRLGREGGETLDDVLVLER